GRGAFEGLHQPDQGYATTRILDTGERDLFSRPGNDAALPRALVLLREVRVDVRKLHLGPAQELRRGRSQPLEIRVGAGNRVQALVEEVERHKGRVVRQVRPHIERQQDQEGLA